jgi:molybdopterin molybdotransferase
MSGSRPPLMTLEDALQQLLAHASVLPAVDCDTLHATGRVLRQDGVAELDVPGFDNSAMDGYAVRAAQAQPGVRLPVTQRIAAGHPAAPLAPGEAARIFTGAPLPAGADAVLMQEDTQAQEDGTVVLQAKAQAGQFVRRRGEDMARGDVVLRAGTRLLPAHVGLAASMGMARVVVGQAPRVALFSTGDELVMPGTVAPRDMAAGAIYNSNRYFLHALLQQAGCDVTDMGIVPDSLSATEAALADAAHTHDVVLTSGGVSVGEEDHIKPAVQALGQLALWSLNIKPGKPFAYGRLGRNGQAGAHFIGLPGNPVSSFVTFVLLVQPFVMALQGARLGGLRHRVGQARFDWPRPDKRREFLRVRLHPDAGVTCFENQSSGVLTSLAWADGLLDNPPGQVIRHGDTVRVIALDRPWLQEG